MPRSTTVLAVSSSFSFALVLAGASGGCGHTSDDVRIDDARRRPPTADVAELEIRGNGVDRFVTCPPPGELGQRWVPPLPPWTPPPSAPPAPDAGVSPDAPPTDANYIRRTADRTPTEQAVEATLRDFRHCFRRGLVHDPAQEGRVAIVLRVGPDGRVANVEEYAACELLPEAIACMKSSAARLRFTPPASGSDAITIPAVFTSRDGVSRTTPTSDDAYTAGAFVTIETARPGLHACEEQARRSLRPVQASGTFTLDIRPDGGVTRAHVDPWTGDQGLLACAAKELEKLRFAAPPSGAGTVVARLNFNPRQAAR
jgi:hypothetical protein